MDRDVVLIIFTQAMQGMFLCCISISCISRYASYYLYDKLCLPCIVLDAFKPCEIIYTSSCVTLWVVLVLYHKQAFCLEIIQVLVSVNWGSFISQVKQATEKLAIQVLVLHTKQALHSKVYKPLYHTLHNSLHCLAAPTQLWRADEVVRAE